jgi:hypothetical protein
MRQLLPIPLLLFFIRIMGVSTLDLPLLEVLGAPLPPSGIRVLWWRRSRRSSESGAVAARRTISFLDLLFPFFFIVPVGRIAVLDDACGVAAVGVV